MDAQQLDKQIQSVLENLPYFSKLGTWLCIKLSDYAAQLNGCRSTRQMNDNQIADIDEQYQYLLDILSYQIHEAITLLKEDHIYKQEVLEMDDDELENLIVETLFSMTVLDCRNIFVDYFFNVNK
jgi:hypothetical protein